MLHKALSINNLTIQMNKKKDYESPQVTVTFVELENAICAGSVDFVGPDDKQGVYINNQSYATDGDANDFSETPWEINTGDNN